MGKPLVHSVIETLRSKLLDLSGRNSLISFRHSDKARKQLRIVDTLPDRAFESLDDSKSITLLPLPLPPFEAPDERTREFAEALLQAKAEDEIYREGLKNLGEKPANKLLLRLELELRDRLRTKLGMPPVRREKVMPREDYARELGIEPDYDLPAEASNRARYARHQKEFQTLLYPDELERKLSSIYEQARLSESETGLNTLRFAFGFLEWYEDETSSEPIFSPLTVYEVQISRALVGGEYIYSVSSREDDLADNICLLERLKKDFDIAPLRLEEEEKPEQYFKRFEDHIKKRRAWKVHRYVTLGFFSFAKISMYQDLESILATTPDPDSTLSTLINGTEGGEPGFAPDYEVDKPEHAKRLEDLITNADSSQMSAIIDARNGKNLVIEGPPGTGKSQTITNIIASTIAEGKSVLFIAEKRAALEVVKKRLDDAGLGTFCLELHSNKIRKTDVLASLEAWAERKASRPRAMFGDTQDRLEEIKRDIGSYVHVLNTPFGATGKTLHEILWRALRLRDEDESFPTALDEIALPGAISFTVSDIETARTVLRALERHREANLKDHPTVESHPWYGLAQAHHTANDSKTLLVRTKTSLDALLVLKAELDTITDFMGELAATTLDELRVIIAALQQEHSLLQVAAEYADAATVRDQLPTVKKAFLTAEAVWAANDQIRATLDPDAHSEPTSADVTDLARHLKALALHDASPQDLPPRLDSAQKAAENWTALANFLHDIASRIALVNDKLTFQEATWILQSATLAKKAPAEIAAYRYREILNPDNLSVINKFKGTIGALREENASLLKIFATTAYNSRTEIEAAAKLLSRSTFWSLFSRKFWQAKSLFRSMAKPEINFKSSEMGHALIRLLTLVDAINDVEADANLRAILGTTYRGLETDAKNIFHCAEWGQEVIHALPSYDPVATSIRKWLFETSVENFATLREFADHPMYRLFVEMVSPGKDRPRRKVSEEIAEHTAELEQLSRCIALTRSIGVRAEFPFAQTANLKALIETRDQGNAFLSKDTTRHALGKNAPLTHDNIDQLKRTVDLVERLTELPKGSRWLALLDSADPRKSLDKNFEAFIRMKASADRANAALESFGSLRHPESPKLSGFAVSELIKRFERAIESSDILAALTDYLHTESDAMKVGAGPLLDAYKRNRLPLKNLANTYEVCAYSSILRFAQEQHPQISRSVSFQFESLREQFIQIENKLVELQRKKIAADRLSIRLTRGVSTGKASELTELGLIQREGAKQKKHIPIRELLKRAGVAIKEMKPCFMMSPLTVAQFLSPLDVFDLVVMDEASQLRPEDAMGAVMRAKQVIVVGDPKQLPPTNFFNFADGGSQGDDMAEDYVDVEEESVLDLAFRSFRPPRRLRWHYRSHHESLIAFSNNSFYDSDLVVFPSPFNKKASHGIQFVQVDGSYDKRRNVPEAQSVVASVAQLMADRPDRSIGVVAINQEQRELIADLMDSKAASDPVIQDYLARWQGSLEPFFVKNLENVQGDERDTIVISTVYGKDPAGNFFQRFGPVNGRMGHRRLNVLFTRAKYQMVVHSSINPDQISTDSKSSEGLRAFKNFLKYAKTGRLDSDATLDPERREPDSDFEVFVMRKLESHGYKIVPQVGVAGYYIDLAVRHPQLDGEFILGIECDGATYHSAKCARDRDKTRQEVLENLGWKIHRIWSTDWFQHPEREIAKVLAVLPPIAS